MIEMTKENQTAPAGQPARKKTVRRRRRILIWLSVSAAVLALCAVWITIRLTTRVECTAWAGQTHDERPASERVFSAVSLSWLVYGCEGCENPGGTVNELLDTQRMGIIIENADIKRLDPGDPSSAMIDSADFLRRTVGEYRFLTDLRDEASSFYGAAFADDENRTVWIAYAGSVSARDALQCVGLAVGAGLTGQEKAAFALYEQVLKTQEIQEGYGLMLTGHSLGGALASMVSRMSGAEALTVSGADGLALRKINSIAGGAPEQLRITNCLTSPDSFGFTVKDCIQRMMFLGDCEDIRNQIYPDNGMVDNSHCVFGFIRFEDEAHTKPCLPAPVSDK